MSESNAMIRFAVSVRKATRTCQRFSMILALHEMESMCEREFSNRVADWLRYR